MGGCGKQGGNTNPSAVGILGNTISSPWRTYASGAGKPELITAHALLHGDVVDRLIQRDHRHLLHAERDERLHGGLVFGRIGGEARPVDQRIHLLALVGGDVEDRVVAVKIPVEVILRIVEPAREAVERKRQLFLVQRRAPVGARNLVD